VDRQPFTPCSAFDVVILQVVAGVGEADPLQDRQRHLQDRGAAEGAHPPSPDVVADAAGEGVGDVVAVRSVGERPEQASAELADVERLGRTVALKHVDHP